MQEKLEKKNFYQTFVPQNHCCDSVPKMKGHIKICTVLLLCCGWAPKAHFCVLQSAHFGEIIFEGVFLYSCFCKRFL